MHQIHEQISDHLLLSVILVVYIFLMYFSAMWFTCTCCQRSSCTV